MILRVGAWQETCQYVEVLLYQHCLFSCLKCTFLPTVSTDFTIYTKFMKDDNDLLTVNMSDLTNKVKSNRPLKRHLDSPQVVACGETLYTLWNTVHHTLLTIWTVLLFWQMACMRIFLSLCKNHSISEERSDHKQSLETRLKTHVNVNWREWSRSLWHMGTHVDTKYEWLNHL